MAKSKQLVDVTLTCDVLSLVERITSLEKKCAELEGTISGNFDYLVECIPKVADNGIQLRAFPNDHDDPIDVVVARVAS